MWGDYYLLIVKNSDGFVICINLCMLDFIECWEEIVWMFLGVEVIDEVRV